MGASESKQSNPILANLEQEAIRAAIPKGLKDERSIQLEYELNWCYNRNNWFFTAGGLLLGLTLGYSMRSVQPVAWAAILAPAGDWLYEQHACRELQEAYSEHQRRLREEARTAAEAARAHVRQQYEAMMDHKAQSAAGLKAAGEGVAAASAEAAPVPAAEGPGAAVAGRRSWLPWRWGRRGAETSTS